MRWSRVSLALAFLSGGATAAAPAPASPAPLPRLDAALVEAFRQVQAGQHAEARRLAASYLEQGRGQHPGQAHFVAGLSFHRQQLYASARARFSRALELEPGYVTTWFFLGFTLLNLGEAQAARQALERYLAVDPGAAEAHFGLGWAALEEDRAGEAVSHFTRASELAERGAVDGQLPPGVRRDVARYQARLGDAHLRREELGLARAALERSVALAPDLPEPWHKLAWVLRRLGDAAGAGAAEARFAEASRRRDEQRGGRP